MSRLEGLRPETINKPEYRFVNPNTLIFITGTPLSGKSTIAPLIVSSIDSCTLQNMDVLRLVAQQIEGTKPEAERNHFVNYGSCDSYRIIGDGSYSPQNLAEGFNAYSKAVSSVLTNIIPGLELQGARNVLFEGVQLTPSIIAPFLTGNNKLIIITSTESQIDSNRDGLYAGNRELIQRYSTEKLLFLQEEILRQSRKIPKDKVFYIDNTGDYTNAASEIIRGLLNSNVIK